jgi:hypothetical protein
MKREREITIKRDRNIAIGINDSNIARSLWLWTLRACSEFSGKFPKLSRRGARSEEIIKPRLT